MQMSDLTRLIRLVPFEYPFSPDSDHPFYAELERTRRWAYIGG